MKTVKSALLGSKQLIDTNADVLLIQLKEIIKEHRALIITRLINDLRTYLDYKFHSRPNRDQLLQIKDKLLSLQDNEVNLMKYQSVINQLDNNEAIRLTNEPFLSEIDESVSCLIGTNELTLFNQ